MIDDVVILKLLRRAGLLVFFAAITCFVSRDQTYAASRRFYTQIIPQDISQSTEVPKGDVSQTESDQALMVKVRRGLEEDVLLSEKIGKVRIIIINGEVTLRGQVNTTSDRQRVEEKARESIGVARVINQLDVSP
jgi:osmotically-inducible protein OsmY